MKEKTWRRCSHGEAVYHVARLSGVASMCSRTDKNTVHINTHTWLRARTHCWGHGLHIPHTSRFRLTSFTGWGESFTDRTEVRGEKHLRCTMRRKKNGLHAYIYISLGRNENNFYTVMRIITLNLTQPSSHVMLTSIEFPSIQRLQIRFVPECSTKIVVSDVSQFTSTRSSLSVWKERLKYCVSQNFLCGYSMYSACKSIHHRDSAWSETRPSRYCVNIVN